MLVHHFGSKEELIAAVLEQVRTALQSSFGALASEAEATPSDLMVAFWEFVTAKAQTPSLRLLLEVQILAVQNPARYRRYLAETSSSWLRVIVSALPPGPNRQQTAVLCAAVIDGLLLEFLSTGNLRSTSAALRLFVARLRPGKQSPRRARR
ncbi:MAG: TetR/AcrR family transcriptional regulator [Verrucomicrobiota bacterium]|nr:TetR/AcrR family transcriptional regulator [Verrucomicrobiota bacterium]